MKNYIVPTLTFLILSIFISCSGTTSENLGVTEAGNPTEPSTRPVKGLINETDDSCPITKVVFFDTASTTTTVEAEVDDDCSFETDVRSGKAWGAKLYNNSSLVATMTFDMGLTVDDSPVYFTSEGLIAVDFGTITIDGDSASASKEPSKQNDMDGDKLPDYYDSDDDGDGISDKDETDCDEDGIIDDLDLDDDCD